MDTVPLTAQHAAEVLAVAAPAEQTVAMVFASPHSGRDYPAEFLAQSALDPLTLRKSEDSFVDELFAGAPARGAPLLRALFPRAFVDPNREAYELDPAMFADALPDFVNVRSPRVSAGLGTIARVVASGAEIYRRQLMFEEAERRINHYYQPYHQTLQSLVDQTVARFGRCLLIDCHSMPSIGRPMDQDTGTARVDVVLGDCYGTACAALVIQLAEDTLRQLGYRVVRNTPYAGGYTTRRYGRPRAGLHALQIELNRRLYMDEATHRRAPAFAAIAADMDTLAEALASLPWSELGPMP